MLTLVKRLRFPATFALAALIATPAVAIVRTTNMNGSACLPDDQNDEYERSFRGYTFRSGGPVHCPVFIDATTLDIEDVNVFVDLPPNATVTCTLAVVSKTGNVIDSDDETTSNDAVGATLDFVRVGVGGAEDASVSLRCTLPVGGRIIGYVVEEG